MNTCHVFLFTRYERMATPIGRKKQDFTLYNTAVDGDKRKKKLIREEHNRLQVYCHLVRSILSVVT